MAGDAVVPAEVADGVVLVDVEVVVVEPLVAFDEVVLWEELSEAELSEPQPPRAAKMETHTNPAHAFSAPILKIIVTCPICVIHAERRRLQSRLRVTQTAFATFGNPAICRQQTGSFAPPPCDGFALERRAVNHEMKRAALCRSSETINCLICFVN